MKLYKRILKEKRSHPDLNPHVNTYDKLEKYKNDPDIYISFTFINKLGLNPSTGYATPLGIYTYPLKQMWKDFDHRDRKIIVPFAGELQYLWVIKKSCNKFIEDIGVSYSNADLKSDIKKLHKKYGKEYGDRWDTFIEQTKKEAKEYDPSPGNQFWNITKEIPYYDSKKAMEWSKILRGLGYCGIADKSNSGIIHPNEKTQAVFFSKKAFKIIEHIDNNNKERVVRVETEKKFEETISFVKAIKKSKGVYAFYYYRSIKNPVRTIWADKFTHSDKWTIGVVNILIDLYGPTKYWWNENSVGVMYDDAMKKVNKIKYTEKTMSNILHDFIRFGIKTVHKNLLKWVEDNKKNMTEKNLHLYKVWKEDDNEII